MNTNTKTIKSPVKLDAEYTRLGIDFFGLDNFEPLLQMVLEVRNEVEIRPSKDNSSFDLYATISDLFTINKKKIDHFFDKGHSKDYTISAYALSILSLIEEAKKLNRELFNDGLKSLTQLTSVKMLLNAGIIDTGDILLSTCFTKRDLERDSIYLMAERRAPRVAEAGVAMQS